jgi:hypothetical protein
MLYFYLLLGKISSKEAFAYQIGKFERKQIPVSELPPKGSLPSISYTSFVYKDFGWRRTFWFVIVPTEVRIFSDEAVNKFNQETNKNPNLLESLGFISSNLDKISVGIWEGLFNKDYNEGPTWSKSGGSSFHPMMVLKWQCGFEFESVMDSATSSPQDVEISDSIKFLPFAQILGGKTE